MFVVMLYGAGDSVHTPRRWDCKPAADFELRKAVCIHSTVTQGQILLPYKSGAEEGQNAALNFSGSSVQKGKKKEPTVKNVQVLQIFWLAFE